MPESCKLGPLQHEHEPPCGDAHVRGRMLCRGARVRITEGPSAGRIYHDDGSLCPPTNGPVEIFWLPPAIGSRRWER